MDLIDSINIINIKSVIFKHEVHFDLLQFCFRQWTLVEQIPFHRTVLKFSKRSLEMKNKRNGYKYIDLRLLSQSNIFGKALTVRHQQLSRNITRSYAHQCQFDDTPPDAIRKWSTIHKYTAQLVHTCLTCKNKPRHKNWKNVKKNINLLNINKIFEKKNCFFKMTDKSYSSPKIIY